MTLSFDEKPISSLGVEITNLGRYGKTFGNKLSAVKMLTFNCIPDFFLSPLCCETGEETGHTITYHYRDKIYKQLDSSLGLTLPVSKGRTGVASGKVRLGGVGGGLTCSLWGSTRSRGG